MRLISGFLVFFLFAATSSSTSLTFEAQSALHDQKETNQELPVIYGRTDDGYPDRVNLRGQIAKMSFTADCGFSRGAGVLQIKLGRTAPRYNGEHVYVVASSCWVGKGMSSIGAKRFA